MHIRSVSVSFQKKLPHPNVDFANMSSLVSVDAELTEDDNLNLAGTVKKLQAQVENLVEQHLDSIAERMRQRAVAAKPQAATENTAATLAAKHGGR
jgi:phosphate uptake regulator